MTPSTTGASTASTSSSRKRGVATNSSATSASPLVLLEKAILIAVKAHAGQKGKDGAPFILHPLRILAKMETEEERIVAVLHDVVEDTDVTFDDLATEGFSSKVIAALKLLTHEEGVSDEDYVKAIKPNRLARRIKAA